jgi:hypothetical protein
VILTVVRIVLVLLTVGFGATLGIVGALGWRGRLTRAGRLGVRTLLAMRSEEGFQLANRVAGPPALVAGVASVAGGVAAALVPTLTGVIVSAVIGLAGGWLIARAGSSLGERAAAGVPAPQLATPAGCSGCACGSAGCGGAALAGS